MQATTAGTHCYRNWRAAAQDRDWIDAAEYPLFTDAAMGFLGTTIKRFGPHELFVLDFPGDQHVYDGNPAFILRIYRFLPNEPVLFPTGTDTSDFTGGLDSDDLCALLSLCLGIRLQSGSSNRYISRLEDPLGFPLQVGRKRNPVPVPQSREKPILPSALFLPSVGRFHSSLDGIDVIANLPERSAIETTTLIRAARLYQSAVWIVEGSPDLSWLLLVSAIEVIAAYWASSTSVTREKDDSIRDLSPELESILRQHARELEGDELVRKVARSVGQRDRAARKFRQCICEFYPRSPMSVRPSEYGQHKWTRSAMKESAIKIYEYRSRALHDGIPFPSPMCEPPDQSGGDNAPAERPTSLGVGMMGAYWDTKDLPMYLHTFEYIVRNSILNWWKSLNTHIQDKAQKL